VASLLLTVWVFLFVIIKEQKEIKFFGAYRSGVRVLWIGTFGFKLHLIINEQGELLAGLAHLKPY
jgi:hypothetical protein